MVNLSFGAFETPKAVEPAEVVPAEEIVPATEAVPVEETVPAVEVEQTEEPKPVVEKMMENGQYVMPFYEDEYALDQDLPHESEQEFVMNRAEFKKELETLGFDEQQIKKINFSYDLAKEGHRHQKRENGERYFEHVRAAALILIKECKLRDQDAVQAALMHDMGEDSPMFGNVTASYETWKDTAKFRLGLIFGERTADMVIALTKPVVNGIEFKDKPTAAEYYHHGLEIAEPETILVKMADRLHNLRTLGDTPPEKQLKQLKETREMYLPLFQTVLDKYPTEGQVMLNEMEAAMKTIEDKLAIGQQQ
ncbi:MAG: HD domain-containing protein [Candidatus Falkowbacteria bacterium]